MKRVALTLLAPPFAVCKFGCAGCCAAPVTVFWLTGIVAIIYGFVGGPGNLTGPSWNTVVLGLTLWGIAALWAFMTIRGAGENQCEGPDSTLCKNMLPENGESASFDKVRKAR